MSATDLTKREDIAPLDNPDVLAQLLAAKRSPRTRHAYAGDLKDFFVFAFGCEEPTPGITQEFLSLDRFAALSLVLRYKAHLRDERGLACIIHESRVKNPETTTRYKLQRLDLNNSLFCLSVTGLSGEKIMVKKAEKRGQKTL